MAEVLIDYETRLVDPDGRQYRPRACGAADEQGAWRGWIEFVRVDGSAAVRTGRETTQRSREDLVYWASGLTAAYLDGALKRALSVPQVPARGRRIARSPAFEGPAPEVRTATEPALTRLDPFALYARGREVLQRRLEPLDKPTLERIIRTHGLSAAPPHELARLKRKQLASLIVRSVEERAV